MPITLKLLNSMADTATSGVSSAYVSESAEREKAMRELERAMAGESLSASAHARAAHLASFFVAFRAEMIRITDSLER